MGGGGRSPLREGRGAGWRQGLHLSAPPCAPPRLSCALYLELQKSRVESLNAARDELSVAPCFPFGIDRRGSVIREPVGRLFRKRIV